MTIAAAPYLTTRHKASHCTDPGDDGLGWCNGLLVARGVLMAAQYDLDAARYGLDVGNYGLTAARGGLDAASLVACCCGLGCGLFCLAVEGTYLDVGLAVAAVFVGKLYRDIAALARHQREVVVAIHHGQYLLTVVALETEAYHECGRVGGVGHRQLSMPGVALSAEIFAERKVCHGQMLQRAVTLGAGCLYVEVV